MRSLHFSPDNSRLASAGWDRTVRIWDWKLAREEAVLIGHHGPVDAVRFSPDGSLLASGGPRREGIFLWDWRNRTTNAVIHGHSDYIQALAFSPDGSKLVSGGGDYNSELRVWDTASGAELSSLAGHQERVSSICFGPDGQLLGSSASSIKIWNTNELPGDRHIRLGGRDIPRLRAIAIAPDGSLALTAGYNEESVRVWELPSGRQLAVVSGHGNTASCSLSISHDGTLAVWGSFRDKSSKIIDLKSMEVTKTFEGQAENVTAVAFSPDAATVASGGNVWDIEFSPDGKNLASASRDKTVKLWNLTSGESVLTLSGHQELVWRLAFSTDGSRLTSVSSDWHIIQRRASLPAEVAASFAR